MNIRLPSGRRESLRYLTYYYSYVHITITYTKYTIMVKEQITIPKAISSSNLKSKCLLAM